MNGLVVSCRAEQALQAKLSASKPSSTSSSLSASTATSITTTSTSSDDAVEPSLADAIDLVMRCLEVDPLNRPTADLICDHRFVMGSDFGWTGPRGWEKPLPGDDDDNDVE